MGTSQCNPVFPEYCQNDKSTANTGWAVNMCQVWPNLPCKQQPCFGRDRAINNNNNNNNMWLPMWISNSFQTVCFEIRLGNRASGD